MMPRRLRRAAAWLASTVATLALAGLAAPAAGAAEGAGEPDPALPDHFTEQAITAAIQRLAARHRQVIRCRDSGIPDGWESLSAGAHIQVVDAGPPVDCWLMPADWVGVWSPHQDPL